ncbi:recombination regulator RecX [Bacillus lacus]|uniref:Regulatory protein RecX n=1 Tax=Metabacillus lacus TaxID=1983721 RepID=A0A7X2J228_9BACI|nr:recombination regulator RecX [Metabacillus lacus]MRX73901.1 recombination regulator RecX [Metabacillus lacus]
MAIVTKISSQLKNEDRFNVYLDRGKGEEYAFSVDQDVLIRFGLRKGKELDELDIAEIQYGDDVKKAFNKAIEYLGYRMRSAKEIRDYLAKKEVDESIVHEVIHRLKEYNYVNDGEFADAFVRSQWKSSGKGPEVIKQELYAKGIQQEQILTSLEQYSMEAQIEEALKHCNKNLKADKLISSVQQKQKLEQMLIRKGFSYDVISICMEELEMELEKDEDLEMQALITQAEKVKHKYQSEDEYTNKMKMKQFLYRKGFPISLIDRYLDDAGE